MRILPPAIVLAVVLASSPQLRADDDLTIERLATCQASWLDSKDDVVKIRKFSESFQSGFTQKEREAFFVPKTKTAVIGLPLLRVFPESVGMGVGFSVMVDAPFDAARKSVEKAAGKSLTHCENGDGMRSCSRELAPKRTLMVMSGDSAKSQETLIGCYYYEK